MGSSTRNPTYELNFLESIRAERSFGFVIFKIFPYAFTARFSSEALRTLRNCSYPDEDVFLHPPAGVPTAFSVFCFSRGKFDRKFDAHGECIKILSAVGIELKRIENLKPPLAGEILEAFVLYQAQVAFGRALLPQRIAVITEYMLG